MTHRQMCGIAKLKNRCYLAKKKDNAVLQPHLTSFNFLLQFITKYLIA